ncbi:MAG: PilZ domain-containing protein [Desulfobacterales bacterium]|nr:PilZ domain-containing protein [Desulfobacterales bacterium]
MTDQRQMERFNIKIPTMLKVEHKNPSDESIQLVTVNACAGGAYFKTSYPIAVGTPVSLTMLIPLDKLNMPKNNKTQVDITGDVIRCDKNGIAISFHKNFKISPISYLL